jgi:phage terminase large subunit
VMGIDPRGWKYNPIKHELLSKHNGSTIRLGELRYRSSDPQWNRLGSKEYTMAAVEECQEIDPRVIDILRARVGRHRNEEFGLKPMILLTANPDKGWIYDEWYDPWRRGALPAYMRFVRSTMADNPFLPDSYRRSVERIQDEATRQRMLEGEWDYAADPLQIIAEQWITEAYRVESVDGLAAMGVDPAADGYGVDDSCIVVVIGNTLTECIRKRYRDVSDALAEEQLADLVIETAKRHGIEPANIRIDTVGPGASLYAVLRSKGWTCTKIYGQANALPRRGQVIKLANLRSQGIYEMGEKLRMGQVCIVPKDPRLKSGITCYRKQDTEKWYAVEDKRVTRRRLGRSPDDGDATWMALLDMPKLKGKATRSTIKRRKPGV